MTFGRAMSLLAKGVLVLGALVGGALVIVRLERDRPRILLERVGVEIGEDADGAPQSVHFPADAARNEHLLQLARFDRLRTIVLRGGEVGPDGLRALQSLRDLRLLDLSHCAGTPECMAELGRLTTLRELRLQNCAWVTDEDLRNLQLLRALEVLDLSDTRVSDAGLAHLLALPRLNGLHLRGCRAVTDDGLQQLARISSLRLVTCTGAEVSRRGVRAFLRGRPNTELRTNLLDVGDLQPLVDGGAQITLDARYEVSSIEWSRSQRVGSVRMPYQGPTPMMLDYGQTVLTRSTGPPSSEALALLADCPALHYLAVEEVELPDAALAPLAAVSALQSIYLKDCPIRGEGLSHLQGHRGLRQAVITSPVLTNEALYHLGRLTQLGSLQIGSAAMRDAKAAGGEYQVSVDDDGLQHLQGLSRLEELSLVELPLTGAGLKHLQALPSLWGLTLQLDAWHQDSLQYVARLPSLMRLDVTGSVNLRGIRHLSSAMHLTYLHLRRTELDADAARELAALPKLTSLHLAEVRMSGGALRALAGSHTLEPLLLQQCEFPVAELEELRMVRPQLEVSASGRR